MIRIIEDYNNFSGRFASFLSSFDLNINLAILKKGNWETLVINFQNSPWGTNASATFEIKKDIYYVIGYDSEMVEECELSIQECDACILHEIGHFKNRDIPSGSKQEILCDKVAVENNMALFMLSALLKMQDKLGLNLQERIDALYPQSYIYRPVWTCGSYNAKEHTAIVYNLIEGCAHYFEDFSADVIGNILTFGRNKEFSLADINDSLDIKLDIASLVDFVIQLTDLGLLTTHLTTNEEILRYRKTVAIRNKTNYNYTSLAPANTIDFVEPSLESAEEAYAHSIAGWTNVIFELTYRCSESCIHCYNEGSVHSDNDVNRRGDRNELSVEEYKHAIDEFKELGMFKICITGGDPFSNSHVWEILEYLYEKEIAVEIYTNGYYLNGNIDRLLSMYPRIVGVSVYSGIPEIHDAVTCTPGSFHRTIATMNELAKYGVPLQLKCCVFSTNFDSYTTVYDLATEFCAIPQIEINIRNTVDGNKYASEHLRLTDEQYRILFSDQHVYPTITKDTVSRFTVRDFSSNVCKAGISSCTLTPEGNIVPCPAFHMTFGNIREISLQDIMNSEKRNWWQSICLKDYKDCGKHDYCNLCAVCPGENFSDTGDPLCLSENKCFLAKKRLEYALELNEQR